MAIQYVVNETGDPTAVVISIEEWNRLLEELQKNIPERDDAQYLMHSETMRERILAAKGRTGGKTWEEVQDTLSI